MYHVYPFSFRVHVNYSRQWFCPACSSPDFITCHRNNVTFFAKSLITTEVNGLMNFAQNFLTRTCDFEMSKFIMMGKTSAYYLAEVIIDEKLQKMYSNKCVIGKDQLIIVMRTLPLTGGCQQNSKC